MLAKTEFIESPARRKFGTAPTCRRFEKSRIAGSPHSKSRSWTRPACRGSHLAKRYHRQLSGRDSYNSSPGFGDWNWFWKGCKPNSVCTLAGGENHLSVQPIPGIRFAFAKPGAGRSGIPYLALHPMGFSVPSRLRGTRCALTAPFHPCQL